MKPLIFTLVGPDKPGLLSSLSKAVYERGGNWLGSNFSHMAGYFAGFVQVDLPLDKHQELVELFSRHPDLTIHLVPGQDGPKAEGQTAQINIMGNDKAGIVQELTKVLNRFDVNITKFDSSCTSAPNWGSPLFKANAVIELGPEVDADELAAALEDIADDLMVDIDLM